MWTWWGVGIKECEDERREVRAATEAGRLPRRRGVVDKLGKGDAEVRCEDNVHSADGRREIRTTINIVRVCRHAVLAGWRSVRVQRKFILDNTARGTVHAKNEERVRRAVGCSVQGFQVQAHAGAPPSIQEIRGERETTNHCWTSLPPSCSSNARC